MTHVGERMKLLNCVSQDMKALAKILASAPRAVSKYRANVPDHLSGHCKMAAGSGLGTRLCSFLLPVRSYKTQKLVSEKRKLVFLL